MYQDLSRRPSTIDGYRTAIVDTLGPVGHHITQVQTFKGYSPVSTGIVQKVPGIFQNGTFLLFSMNSQKPSFEPMKDTDLKHLTLKTAFFPALASGKRRSEKIHAWVANKVSNLGQWEKVALFPSDDFIAKKTTSKRRFSKCVSSDYSCFDYHCRDTIQGRQDLVSGVGPEVLFRSNQRPERVSICPF